MSDTPRTVEQDLGYFGVSLNEPEGGYRPLLLRAREELDRAKGLLSPVICCHCDTEVARADEWFRCYDCRGHLCRSCCKDHFGAGHQPHPKQIQQYESALSTTRQQLLAAQVEVKRLRDALELAKNGLEWYADSCPEYSSPADDEAMDQIDAALATPPDLSALSLLQEHAELYRWLREQHWNDSICCVVTQPKHAVKLGYDCPSGDRLDALIKSAMLAELDQAPQSAEKGSST